jgi:hypothetical protein
MASTAFVTTQPWLELTNFESNEIISIGSIYCSPSISPDSDESGSWRGPVKTL